MLRMHLPRRSTENMNDCEPLICLVDVMKNDGKQGQTVRELERAAAAVKGRYNAEDDYRNKTLNE